MSENSEKAGLTYQTIFDGMDKLAKHGFEYFLAGISTFILIAGIIITPGELLSQQELLVISIFGFFGVASSLYVWRQKAAFRMRSNEEKIAYKKFISEQKTRRLRIVEKSTEIPLDDLEEIE